MSVQCGCFCDGSHIMLGIQNPVTTVKNFSFRRTDKLGKGATGSVYRGTDNTNGNQVAIKVIDMKDISNEVTRYLLNSQKNALSGLNHHNIVRCLDIVQESKQCFIITEYCSEGSLAEYVKKRGNKLPEAEALELFKGIVSGCRMFHERGVVHRDLKPSNILIKGGVPKISDFGYCQIAGSKKPRMFYNVGSPSYMSPEAYIKSMYTEKSDVWALGMLLYEILNGSTMDKGKEITNLYDYIRNGGKVAPAGCSPHAQKIMQSCLRFDFNKRIGIKDLDALVSGVVQNVNTHMVNQPQESMLRSGQQTGRQNMLKSNTISPRAMLVSVKSHNPDNSMAKKSIINESQISNRFSNRKTVPASELMDALNVTDPNIKRSYLSDKPKRNTFDITTVERVSNGFQNPVISPFGFGTVIENKPRVVQMRQMNPVNTQSTPLASKYAVKIPLQVINNMPVQHDTLKFYRQFM